MAAAQQSPPHLLCEPHWIAVGSREREPGPRARRLGLAPEGLPAQWAARRTDTPGTLLTWLNLRVKATTFGARLCFSFLLHPQLANSWEAESTEFSQDAKPQGMCLDCEQRGGQCCHPGYAQTHQRGEGRGCVYLQVTVQQPAKRKGRNTLYSPSPLYPIPKISLPKCLLLSLYKLLWDKHTLYSANCLRGGVNA